MQYHAHQIQGDDDFSRAKEQIYERSSIVSGLREEGRETVTGNPFKTLADACNT